MSQSPHPIATVPRLSWLAGIVIVFATLLAYANTLHAPFIFDDKQAIADNPTIRSLTSPQVLAPPPLATGAAGRPLVNLSLALNYAAGGLRVEGYHVFNWAVHAIAALLLFGVLRRTLLLPSLRDRFGEAATPLAFFIALIWALHPLLTESVTCVVQRNELMAGACLLAMLYGLTRGWLVFSFVVTLLGVLCKEIVAVAPLLAFVYQAAFLDGSWRAAWRSRGKFCALLMLNWLPLAWLIATNQQRGGTVGFGLGISSWEYLLTQCKAIVLYLQLTLWPHPLVVDYGTAIVKSPAEVWPQALLILALLAATVVAWRRSLPVFFVALCFWAILAPSSSVLPLTTQTIAEHRMYLPLAAVLTLITCGAFILLGRRSFGLLGAMSVGLGLLTAQHNTTYRDTVALWRHTIAHAPDNPRAHANLGIALVESGEIDEAIRQYEIALQLKPDFALAHFNLGAALDQRGAASEAIAHYREAIRLKADYAPAHYNLGYAYARQQRWPEAEAELATAARLDPYSADIQNNLGNVLTMLGRHAEALPHFEAAVRAAPDTAGLRVNLALALARAGRRLEARAQLETALRLQPDFPEARRLLPQISLP